MKIRVGSVYYTIQEITTDPDADFIGRHHPHKLIIEIEQRLPNDRKTQTLFHELFHAIGEEYSIKLNEKHCDILSTAILSLLRDNPKLKEMI